MMTHLETLMIWSLTAMTARVAGAHVFTRERQNFPLRGRWLHPPGSPLTGQAPLRCAKPAVSPSFAPQKTKASLTTFAHTKAFVMSVCSHALAQKTKSLAQRRVLCGFTPHVLPPSGPVPLGLTLRWALKQRVPYTKACFMIEHARCARTKAFIVSIARWRLHKGVFYENTSWLYCQCACN